MADSRSSGKSQSSPQDLQANGSISSQKSYIHILCKSLFVFLLFLVAIPFFPFQSLDFINHACFTKLWERFHLLFIGLAVCYGLFSRRNVEVDFEPPSNYFDDSQSSFVSRIFHVSPIFEEGSETQAVFDDKYVFQTLDSEFYRGRDSTVNVANDSSAVDHQSNTENFSNSEIGTEIPLKHDENRVVQAWNSQYLHGEPVAVVHDEWGKHPNIGGHQLLGLPVRRPNSMIRNADSSHLGYASESGASWINSSSSSPTSMEEEKIGDMEPMNLEMGQKFDENIFLPSQVPWDSRSVRPEFKERVGPISDRSQFRSLSVDETQFESFKSQSFRSMATFSSQASSMSNSPNLLSPPTSSYSDSLNSTEESGEVKEQVQQDATYASAPQSPQIAKNNEVRLNAFHLRRYSGGSLFQKDTSKKEEGDRSGPRRRRRENPSGTKGIGHGSLKSNTKPATIVKDMPEKAIAELNGLIRKRKEDSSGNKESLQGSMKSDMQPPTVIKDSSRGKYVGTIRRGVYSPEAMQAAEMSKNHINEKVGRGFDEAKAINIGINEMRREGFDNTWSGVNKKNLDSHYEVLPKATFAKYKKREQEEYSENVTAASAQKSETEIDDFQPSLSIDAVAGAASDAGHDPNEVDKKAGEFIAKFREQIRLQKAASVERSNGLRLSGKYLR